MQVTLVAAERRASYAAAVRVDPDYVVVLVAADLPMPKRGLELRGPGIWADHNVEEPLDRWSLGLEAFGVGVTTGPEDLEVLLAASGSPDLRGIAPPWGGTSSGPPPGLRTPTPRATAWSAGWRGSCWPATAWWSWTWWGSGPTAGRTVRPTTGRAPRAGVGAPLTSAGCIRSCSPPSSPSGSTPRS